MLRNVINKIQLRKANYIIDSNHLYRFMNIRLSIGRDIRKFKFRDNFECYDIVIKDLHRAFILISSNKYKYLCLDETNIGCLTVYLTNNTDYIYDTIGCLSQSLLIPIKNNEDRLTEMLLNMIFAKEYYNNYKMTNMTINTDAILLESKNSELNITRIAPPFIEPSSNDRDLYIISEDDTIRNWYTIRLLSDVNVNENNTRSIILNRKQLDDFWTAITKLKCEEERKIV